MSARDGFPLGLVHGLAIEEYHASAGVSNSGLSDFARSPLHYHALHLNPDRPPVEETPAQLAGNLAHCAILEADCFEKRYAIGPNVRRGTKVWDAFEASLLPSQTGIKPDQAMVARAQAASVRSIPDLAALLAKGDAEVSAWWADPATGMLCRCRPDFVHPVRDDAVILVDVKSCGDASPAQFARQIGRMAYHRQAALYTDGYEAASGKTVLAFIFAAVETSWPFAASAVMLDDESLELGRAENRALLERFAECERTDSWPGYSDSIEMVTLPRWLATEQITTTTEESEPA